MQKGAATSCPLPTPGRPLQAQALEAEAARTEERQRKEAEAKKQLEQQLQERVDLARVARVRQWCSTARQGATVIVTPCPGAYNPGEMACSIAPTF